MIKKIKKIPKEWSVKKLVEMGKFVSGGTPDTEKPEYWNGDVIWLTPSEITKLPTRFVSDSERKITKAGLKNSSAVLLPVGSLIVCTRATVGDCCINTAEVSTNQGFKNLIPRNNDANFLYYLISSHKTDLIRKACGSTFLEISKHDIERLEYSVPPLAEQEKIAEILGCWDTAIEKLTALIEQKKLLKKGLMQRLLTGKQRLPGFSTPWNKVKLKNICDISKGEQLGRLEMTETGVYPVINGGISKSGLTDSYNREKDTITISEGGNSCGFVAFMKERFWCGGHCYALSNLQTNLHFLFQILKSKESDIMKLRVGSGLPNIQKSSLDAFSLHIPTDISEQKAIADILSKADEEIDLLTRKLSALKEQKTGLMQKLLTGQIRVKVA